MKSVVLPDGERVPMLGQGTWRVGENKRAHAEILKVAADALNDTISCC